MEPKRTTPDRPPCLIAWCDADHRVHVRNQRPRVHTRSLATCTGNGMRLDVRLTQAADVHGIPTEPPAVVLTVTQDDIRAEPIAPGLLRLDARRATDLGRMLEAACGPHWLSETLDRAVRMIADADRTGGLS